MMVEYIGDYLIEDNTGKSDFPFWVYWNNGYEYQAIEYFRTYSDAEEWVSLRME